MALELSIAACVRDSCGTLVIKETTGAYDADSNSTGWNSPNPDIADYHYARIDILLPDGVTTVSFDFDNEIFPTTDTAYEYEITATALYGAGATVITDGIYHITYTVQEDEGSGSTYTTDCYYLFSCNTKCCRDKLFKKIAISTDCSCDSTVIKNALYVGALYESLLANKDCGNPTAINTILTKLNAICGFSETDCGCS